MLLALETLPRLMHAVLRHLFAYGELLSEETAEALRRGRRRALGLAVALTAGLMALVLGCLWVIAATWNGPNRLVAVGGLCVGFGFIALIGAIYARGGGPGAPRLFERLRVEWRADIQELGRLDPTLVGQAQAPVAGGQSAGLE